MSLIISEVLILQKKIILLNTSYANYLIKFPCERCVSELILTVILKQNQSKNSRVAYWYFVQLNDCRFNLRCRGFAPCPLDLRYIVFACSYRQYNLCRSTPQISTTHVSVFLVASVDVPVVVVVQGDLIHY